jgi:small subunit ribosomal protein S1
MTERVLKMKKYFPENYLIATAENRNILSSVASVKEACYSGKIVEVRATVCDKDHNLHVDLGVMKGVIPRDEGAIGIDDGSVRDIAIISRVNKPVCFKVLEIEEGPSGVPFAVLSRRMAQEECMNEYISKLRGGDVINAVVTHLEPFGAFCDIGCGISALLPVDGISVSRIPHPAARLSVGKDIKAVVRSIDETGRVTLSMKELLGTWEENVSQFSVGETVPGIVRSVESYGIFVELAPNLAGLAELTDGIEAGHHCSVFIKNIIPDRMKLKLIIVDSFSAPYAEIETKYFYNGNHIDSFLYSPECCDKIIRTDF